MNVAQLFDGNDDRALADAVTEMLRGTRCSLDRNFSPRESPTAVESTAFSVWDSCAMISSGGFLFLFENDADLSCCAESYQRIGLNTVAELINEVHQFVPPNFQNQKYEEIGETFADWTENEDVYAQFRSFDRRYFDMTSGEIVPHAVSAYIRKHRTDINIQPTNAG